MALNEIDGRDQLGEQIDFTDQFTTEQKFKDHTELYVWARSVGKQIGFIVTTAKSSLGEKKFLKLGCARSGKYEPYKGKCTTRIPRSKKCDCPFLLSGKPDPNEGNAWILKVICGRHNHEISNSALSHEGGKRKTIRSSTLKEEQLLKRKFKSASIALTSKFGQSDIQTKKRIIEKMDELAFPGSRIPEGKSSKEWGDMHLLTKMPSDFQSFICNIRDVTPYGNCGFRCLANFLGKTDDDAWEEIRNSMTKEMETRAATYMNIFGEDKFARVKQALNVKVGEEANGEHWFLLPEMGVVAATAFQLILITLSVDGSSTFVPIVGAPPTEPHCIVLGHVDKNHWVQVLLYIALISSLF